MKAQLAAAALAAASLDSCPQPTREPTPYDLVDAPTGKVLGKYLSDQSIACLDPQTCADFSDDPLGHGVRLLHEGPLCIGPALVPWDDPYSPPDLSGNLYPATSIVTGSGVMLRPRPEPRAVMAASADELVELPGGGKQWSCRGIDPPRQALAFPAEDARPGELFSRYPRSRLVVR